MKKYSKYAIYQPHSKKFILLNEKPNYNNIYSCCYLEDFQYLINGEMLVVEAKQVQFGFNFDRTWIDSNNKETLDVADECVKYGYKTLLDVFKNQKRAYTKYWYHKTNLKPLKLTIGSGWVIQE